MNEGSLPDNSRFSNFNLFSRFIYCRRSFRKWIFVRKNFNKLSEITLESLINDKIGKILFEKYIGIEKSTPFPEILIKWRGYCLCKEIKENIHLLNEQETRDKLILWSPSLLWEEDVMRKIEEFEIERNISKMEIYLNDMMEEFIMDMEISSFYFKFIHEIKYEQEKIKDILREIFDEELDNENVLTTIL